MAIKAPLNANGTDTRITSGSRTLSNCEASTRKMTNSASIKVPISAFPSVTN